LPDYSASRFYFVFMPKLDLHIHSTASDGVFTPEEVVRKAKKEDFSIIALSDHDTMNGVAAAVAEGEKQGVAVIPAIEMSTSWQGERVHMLGYGLNQNNKQLNRALNKFIKERIRRAKKITEKLNEQGFKIYWSDLSSKENSSIGRPHIAQAVLSYPENREKLPKDMDWGQFIENYLTKGKPAFVKKNKMDSVTAIKVINQAGGKAVWAHPAYYTESYDKIRVVIEQFQEAGLAGLEVFTGITAGKTSSFSDRWPENTAWLRPAVRIFTIRSRDTGWVILKLTIILCRGAGILPGTSSNKGEVA